MLSYWRSRKSGLHFRSPSDPIANGVSVGSHGDDVGFIYLRFLEGHQGTGPFDVGELTEQVLGLIGNTQFANWF